MAFLFALLLATAFPSASQTSWMRPDAFRLTIGMDRLEAVKALRAGGWETKPGKHPNEMIVDYSGDKSLTLEFREERLRSARFELFTILPQIRPAFDEARRDMKKERGEPKKLTSKSIVVYDNALPNVVMVVSDDPKSQHGRNGLGFLAVRYYDPR